MSSEQTPLFSTSSEASRFVSNLFTSENMEKAGTVAKTRMVELRTSLQDGDFSIRILALLAAVALVFVALGGFIGSLLALNVTHILLELYTLLLGVIMLILESQQLQLPETFMRQLFYYALFLKFIWGRGVLYFVAGSLQISQGSVIDWGVGGFVMFVGVLYVIVGRATANKLKALRDALFSEQTLRDKFQQADVSGKGMLTPEQFKSLTDSLGMNLNRRECEAAFLHLDKSHNGELSFEEFQHWWKEYDGTDSFRNSII